MAYYAKCGISIHAPHEGERRGSPELYEALCDISIHAPHEGERLRIIKDKDREGRFQSTLPTRGSDALEQEVRNLTAEISIHAPHEGERQEAHDVGYVMGEISIHAPHEGERLAGGLADLTRELFQSTLPTRGSDRS